MLAEALAAQEFLDAFRLELADRLRGLGLRRSDFPLMERDWSMGESRFEQGFTSGAVPVNFRAALSRFARDRLPEFRPRKDPDGIEFAKLLPNGAHVFVRFEKLMRRLGKVYKVSLGFSPPEPLNWRSPQLPLIAFYDGLNAAWTYRTLEDLEATLREIGSLLENVIGPLEDAVAAYPSLAASSEEHMQGPLSLREAVLAAAEIVARRAPGCTYLSGANITLVGVEAAASFLSSGRLSPGAAWLISLDDLIRHQSLRLRVPYSGVLSPSMRDDIQFMEGVVHAHRSHQPEKGEFLMLPDLSCDSENIRQQLRLTLIGMADSPEVTKVVSGARKNLADPEMIDAMFRRQASETVDPFERWTFTMVSGPGQPQARHEQIDCSIDPNPRIIAG